MNLFIKYLLILISMTLTVIVQADELPGQIRTVPIAGGETIVVNVRQNTPTIIAHDAPFAVENNFSNKARIESKGNRLIIYPYVNDMDITATVIVASRTGEKTYFLVFRSVSKKERHDKIVNIIADPDVGAVNESRPAPPSGLDAVDIVKMARNDLYPDYVKFINERVGQQLMKMETAEKRYVVAREALIGRFHLLVLSVENKSPYAIPMSVTHNDWKDVVLVQAFPAVLSPRPKNAREASVEYAGRAFLYLVSK